MLRQFSLAAPRWNSEAAVFKACWGIFPQNPGAKFLFSGRVLKLFSSSICLAVSCSHSHSEAITGAVRKYHSLQQAATAVRRPQLVGLSSLFTLKLVSCRFAKSAAF